MNPFIKNCLRHVLFTLTFVFISTGISLGQNDQGRIKGTVTDANGAVVPGATVTVKNEKTGETRTANVTDDGNFAVVALSPSAYTVTASGGEFETAAQTGVQILVGQELDLTLQLQAKGVTAQVDVVTGGRWSTRRRRV